MKNSLNTGGIGTGERWGYRKEKKEERSCLESALCLVVLLIFSVILFFLLVLSVTSSTAVYGGAEQVWYYSDSPFYHLFVFILLTVGGIVVLKGFMGESSGALRREDSKDRTVFCQWMIIISGFYIIWIMGTLLPPVSDQRLVMESGKALVDGDLSPWNQVGFKYGHSNLEGYAYTYPHQNGQILFAALLTLIAGDHVAFLWQLLNVAFLAAGMIYTSRLARETLELKGNRFFTIFLFVYLPFAFYFTFSYGTIPGFSCSAAAVWYEWKFLTFGRKRDLFLSAIFISLAILFKSNYLIVLTAMVIFFLADAMIKKRILPVFGAVAVLAVYLFSHQAVSYGLSLAAGHSVKGGPPMLTWVEMGLQEGSRAPGWFNNYNVHVYLENQEDADLTRAAVEQDLAETFRDFLEDPGYASDFFVRKLQSMWAEPTFQSLWIQEVKGKGWLFPWFTKSLFWEGGAANEIYWEMCNAIQSMVYASAFLFAVFRIRRVRLEGLIFAVIFIGGFLFHLFWEAKGQYAVGYFILLLPYAWMGFRDWILWFNGLLDKVHKVYTRGEKRRA